MLIVVEKVYICNLVNIVKTYQISFIKSKVYMDICI